MRVIVLGLALLLAGPALACDEDVPAGLKAEFLNAKSQRDAVSRPNIEAMQSAAPDSFCLRYELALIHLRAKEYDAALKLLADLDPERSVSEYFGETALNTRGFAKLMLEQYEAALEDFSRQIEARGFEAVEQDQRLKVHNNRGFALMQLDRYDEALNEFGIARGLGSKLAERNIAVVQSIIETLKAGNPDLPGSFAAVVGTSPDADDLTKVGERLVAAGVAKPGELQIFERPDGRMSMTVGANESYPKADGRLATLRTVVTDAFVASTAEWRNLTEQSQQSLDQGELQKLLGPHGEPDGYTPPLSAVALPEPLPLSWDKSQTVNSIQVHERIACNLEYVVQTLHKEGLFAQLGSYGGSYAPRRIRGSSRWSVHSWGIAVDFDPESNQLRWGRDRARFAQPEFRRLHEIFEEGGFFNMGRIRNFEWNHFEIRVGILRGVEPGPPNCR